MIKTFLVIALIALAGCSSASPVVEAPATPSTLLLPAGPAPTQTPSFMFIGELVGASINNGNTWVAVAELTVLDGAEEPVAGVIVSGEWDEGDTEEASCTTDEAGTCELESDSLRKRVPRAVLEITALDHDNLEYRPNLDVVDDPEERPRQLAISKP
jgi:hypothetical protein